jgi:hypothetical protein
MINEKIPKQLKKEGFRFIKVRMNSKIPSEMDWQNKNNYLYNDEEFLKHKGNYGVCTGYNNLLVIDFDDLDAWEKLKDELPKTFAVKTASKGMPHLYYYCDDVSNFAINRGKDRVIDGQGKGKQVIGVGSEINDKEYKIFADYEITKLPLNILKKIKNLYKDENKKAVENTTKTIIEQGVSEGSRNEDLFKIACRNRKDGVSKEITIKEINFINQESKKPLPQTEIKTLIESAYKYENKNLTNKDEEIKILLNKPKKKYQSLGIGVHDNVFYFGTTIEKENLKLNAIITSDKKIYVSWINYFKGHKIEDNKIKQDFGLEYRFDLFDDCIDYMWSNKSISQWLYEDIEKISLRDIFELIKNKNKELVYHVDERTHIYVACDIISNYFYPLFNSKGRTYFSADFESGKSRQSLIYQLLSFNPLFASNISPASFERVIESTGGTIIVDNFDNMPEELKNLTLQVIEVYYKKGGKKITSSGENNKPIAYNGYSPLIINNIIGLNHVTESRCNKILMLRTDKKEITDKKITSEDIFWNETRDKLHILALQNWEKVRQYYQKLEIKEFKGRTLEKTEAVLTIAKCISEDVFNDLISFLKEINEQQDIKELNDNWEFILFEQLKKEQDEEIIISNKKITDAVLSKIVDIEAKPEKINDVKMKFSRYIGKVLSSTPVFKKFLSMGKVKYIIRKEDLNKIIRIKGFDKYLDDSTKSTNPTNPTNPTNSTTNNNADLTLLDSTINNNNEKTSKLVYPLKNKKIVESVGLVESLQGGGDNIENVTIEDEIEETIPQIIKFNDKGEGLSFHKLKVLSGLDDEDLSKKITYFKRKGDIFEHKPDRLKAI